ncbi:MAG: glycosyltransferase [Phenylobacterium sp.]|uniref:glycosyltransferase n=1 Tax=Phenylobacterium sp. TaxID=1871053 RepID=UPI00391D60E0
MNPAPKVSVIVPHYNDLAGLEICLQTLERQTLPRDQFEIVVADNASPQGEAAVAGVIAGRARLVIVREKGAGPARNGGVAASRGEMLAFIDSDCQAEPEWLEQGLAALADYDFIGGRVKVLVDDPARMTGAEAFERVFAFDFKTYITKKGFTGSGNLFCPRSLFEEVGGFRTGLSEDLEWSHRARAAGYRLGYAPLAVVGHPARRSWEELRAKWRRVNAETWGLSAGRSGRRLRWLLRNLALPASAVVHSPKVLASRELHTFGQRLRALGTLYRLRFWRLADSLRILVREP